MADAQTDTAFRKRLTSIEREYNRSPHAIAALVVRLRGRLNERALIDALGKVSRRHPVLRSRLMEDADGALWFTDEGAGEPWVSSLPRSDDQAWIEAVEDSCRVPFDLEARPAVRFLLLTAQREADLVILAHYVLGDGRSLMLIARDLLTHLANPQVEAGAAVEAAPLSRTTMPVRHISPGRRMSLRSLNARWSRERVSFNQEDYRALHRAYWVRYPHRVLTAEWDEPATAALLERCRAEGVASGTALAAAVIGAQVAVLGPKAFLERTAVEVDLRQRLPQPPGDVLGRYVATVRPRVRYDLKRGFWENARRLEREGARLAGGSRLWAEALRLTYVDGTLLEAIPFKELSSLVPADSPRRGRLTAFARRHDALERMALPPVEAVGLGTAMTDLGTPDWAPEQGGLTVESMLYKPGSAQPLSTVNLALGAACAAGRLSLVVEYVEDNVPSEAAREIRDRAVTLLRE